MSKNSTAAEILNFQSLFEAAPGLFLALTPDFQVLAVTHAYLTAFMTQRDKIVGRDFLEAFSSLFVDL